MFTTAKDMESGVRWPDLYDAVIYSRSHDAGPPREPGPLTPELIRRSSPRVRSNAVLLT